ncbi:metal dependent phosphohydrolase [Dictyoglomus turgidum DSM 6724]|uniref:Metal dependent phosphohydrolase n=1 Tax=Dictyoglomus turgidum (strain DSM 6724 / Z-1310) TaxID=515635 RepID=B8DZ30_DICTD|nr:metal dependent phosphohydrolase [Dictyoglomus turgidum DSM 6724]HBU31215.1 HD domain-containing protein [Dictyoglomus sp.]
MSLLAFLLAFSEQLDSQLPENRRHSSRVANISLAIANHLKLPEKSKYELVISALLHDAGNGNKNNNYNHKEISDHALKSSLFLSDIPFLERPATIIKYHHFSWNLGRGEFYQDEKIPIESQILNLAEHIDENYDKSKYILKEKNKIIKKIKEKGENLFHPDVLNAFYDLSQKESFWFEINYDNITPKDFYCDIKLDIDSFLLLSKAIARIVDYRSRIQVRHSRNVANISSFLAGNLNINDEKIKRIRISGYLHDIGKVALSSKILLKKDKLTRKETEYIKVHPFKTFLTLKNSIPFEDIIIWSSYHHEKLNGKGYPFRLKGNEIPIEARIVATADIYSALLEDRPYRKGVSEKMAINYMRRLAREGYIDKDIFEVLYENREELKSVIRL